MKYVLYTIILIAILFCLAGCNDSNSELQRLRISASEFAAKWIDEYGDGKESVRNYNIALTQQIVNRQAQAIEELNKKIRAVELVDRLNKHNIDLSDPND